jgi:virginiamycin B lyase
LFSGSIELGCLPLRGAEPGKNNFSAAEETMKKLLIVGLLTLLTLPIGFAASAGTISGNIKGPDGAPFRAAFVRVQNAKTKMTMMVLSDAQGKYWTDKLDAGTYDVWATSVGYKGDPVRRSNVALEDGKGLTIDFTMQKSMVEWSDLTKYQAGTLLPEATGKGVLIQQCFNCHAFGKIGAVGRHDQAGWKGAIEVMRQLGVARIKPEVEDQVSQYLAVAFGSDSATPSSPTQLPDYQKVKQERDYFSDAALNIVYVDYELTGDPKDRPGTAKQDKDGNLWMEMSGGLSRLNSATGEVKTWRLFNLTSNFIHEILPTPDGSVWLTLEAQGGLARFDTKTEKFEVFIDQQANDKFNLTKPLQKDPNDPFPNLPNPAGPQGGDARSHTAAMDLEGNIWVSGRPLKKLDPRTGKYTYFSAEAPDTYGIAVDHAGNVWFAQFNARDHQDIGVVDVKTNKVTKFQPPSGVTPRRLKIDSQGMIWIGDYFGGSLTRFDPKTQEFKIFKLPGPMPTPYGVAIDHADNVWYASMYTDVMGRLDPRTGKVTEYPSPYGERGTRDMFEDAQGRIWYGAQPYYKAGYFRVRTESERAAALGR